MNRERGYTLVEMSIVLVIIGLIVGGVTVGRTMIESATTRSQITQIDAYQAAIGAFRLKFNCLPGDCSNAASFGLGARGPYAGQGDGNAVIQGNCNDAAGANAGHCQGGGETVMVWSDLSSAGLIDQTFNTASSTTRPGTLTPTSTPSLAAYFPTARITSNYVYVWSGGISQTDGRNYFGLAAIGQIASGWQLLGAGGARPEKMTVIQAYTIDLKVDDGMPHTGKVTATELYGGAMYATYTTGSGGPNVCSDRPSGAGPQIYALDVNYGSGTGCALSFAFQ